MSSSKHIKWITVFLKLSLLHPSPKMKEISTNKRRSYSVLPWGSSTLNVQFHANHHLSSLWGKKRCLVRATSCTQQQSPSKCLKELQALTQDTIRFASFSYPHYQNDLKAQYFSLPWLIVSPQESPLSKHLFIHKQIQTVLACTSVQETDASLQHHQLQNKLLKT